MYGNGGAGDFEPIDLDDEFEESHARPSVEQIAAQMQKEKLATE